MWESGGSLDVSSVLQAIENERRNGIGGRLNLCDCKLVADIWHSFLFMMIEVVER